MTIKPLYIEEVMRFIYILGILLLIAIGFLVYVYRDSLWGTIDGFQAGGAGNVVFQLFEQRCLYADYQSPRPWHPRWTFFPTVSKSNALLMCNKLGGRLATYEELKNAVSAGFVIDSDKPAIVIDSDATYVSNNNTLSFKGINKSSYTQDNMIKYKIGINNVDTRYQTLTGIAYDDINVFFTIVYGGYDFFYYDLDGYVISMGRMPEPNSPTDPNFQITGYSDDIRRNNFLLFNRPKLTETYGHPVCIAPTAPPGNTVDVVFPTRAGRGWNDDNNNYDSPIGGTSFTKRYNIRKAGDTTPFNATCPMPSRGAAGSTITLVSSTDPPSVSLNTPAPTTPQTSYNILNMDAIHTQVDIAAIDLPIRRDAVIANEQANISAGTISTTVADTDLNPAAAANEGGRRVRNAYASLIKQALAKSTEATNLVSDFGETMSTILSYYQPQGAIVAALQNGAMTPTQFSNMLLQNIDDYYNALSLTMSLHPVAFLRKGVINFPSFLNTFKIYNLPDPNQADLKLFGWISTKKWEIKTGEANAYGLKCVDGTSDRWYKEGPQPTNDFHEKEGWWCRHTQGLSANLSCEDGHGYSGWAATCLKEYYQVRTQITDVDYMIGTQTTQKSYDIDGLKYNKTIDASWTPVGDTGNAILANLASVNIRRSIPVTGTISATNIREIDDSISLSICLNFTDTSNLQSQIRISSDDYKIYMSPDGSAKPEYKTTIQNGQSYLTLVNAGYNTIHCPIEITAARFFLLPFHTRNLISQWANARYNRIFGTTNPNANTGLTYAAMQGGAGGGTGSSGSTVAVDARVPAFLNTPDATKFASTSISTEIKNKFLDNVAKFFYERERTVVGSSNQSGYATIHKFVDVFQVGDTIFDIRYEEYRKRGLYFQQQLQALDAEYKGYKTMNLSKDDQIEMETRYLQKKTALYTADDNYIWGTPQDCGVAAQYIVIDSKNKLFDLSQIVVVNSAGQNVALNATVHQSLRNMDYGPTNTDPRTKKYYDAKTGNEYTGTNLTAKISAAENDMLATKEAMLTDGTYKRRYSPNTYKTLATIPARISGTSGSPAPYSPLILDLGQTHNVSVVQIILPANVTGATADMYTVQLKKLVPTAGGSSGLIMGSSGSDTTGSIGTTDGTITFRYLGVGKDTSTCPYNIYTRFQVARFYTTRTTTAGSTDSPWTVTGYSKGAEAALTFDSRYNAGVFVDTSKNGGNLQPAYYPNVTYSLNLGGSAPPLVCSDPAQIKRVFNDYNILVNSDTFRYDTRLKTPFNNYPGEKYTATKVTYAGQDGDKCVYLWSDKVVANNAVSYKTRQGAFPYPFDTQNFNAYERVLDISGIMISDYTSATPPAGMEALGCGSGGGSGCAGMEIPEMYIKSVTLDAAGGFCPALKCSDTEVMNSLINIYNTNLPYYSQNGSSSGSGSAGMPQISKIHKAITPSATQCEFLVDTVGGAANRKVQFNNIVVKGPHTMQQNGPDGKQVTNEKCVWVAALSGTVTDSAGQITVVPGVVWDSAPNMVDSTPYLTRMYNYALDIMRPFSNNVTSVVKDLISMGSAQLDPAGSGIVNALVQYRTDTVAAAGDIRYFQNVMDEFGNTCGKPNCKSPAVLNSLYKYYASSSGSSGSSNSKFSQVLRAGMTDDEQFCDFTFTVDNYNYQGPSVLPPTSQTSSTSGLRCRTKRIPFSCNFAVDTCSYINPMPTLADIEAIPSNFAQSLSTGSPGLAGSTTTDITTAPLGASGSQSLLQPPNGRLPLRSIDYIDCRSRYGGNTTNTSLTQCSPSRIFTKVPGSLMLVPSGWSRGSLPPGITLLTSAPSVSTVQALVPYTVVSSAGSLSTTIFEYRITTENTLDFGQTFLCASFYTETDGSTQLAYLVPADTATSPNAFLATSQNFVALANQFRSYWNGVFVKNKNVGNKIGTIAGYTINRADDSITFVADSATFGPLGKYDVQKYYSAALYKVFFRIPYTGTGTGPFIYKLSPTPSGTIQESSGTSGTFTPLSTGQAGSDPSSEYVIQSPQQIMNTGLFRSFKFTVTKVAQDTPIVGTSPRTRAEITRIYFYAGSQSSGTSSYAFTPLSPRNAVVSLDGVYSNYTITSGSCSTGYTGSPRQTNTGDTITDCIVNPGNNASYVPSANVACGIGYYKDDSNNCISSGYYQEVLNPALITTNKFVPRLRLTVGQPMTVDFNEINPVNAFSFVLGSSYNRPLQWTLQGSINNTDWINLQVQSTDFPYATTVTAGNAKSFFNPGYFLFSFSGAGVLSNTRSAATQVAQYLQQGSTETVEGFKGPEPNRRRMRTLRWKILETQRPNAAYVHASMLRFFTAAGPVPTDAMKITNPHGSRRSAADGPTAILSDQEGKRWVDYNKSELLITFDLTKLPSNPIYGFQFTIPSGTADAKDYFPARWLLEGSYDGRTWDPIHKKSDKARILGGASPVYKFSQSI